MEVGKGGAGEDGDICNVVPTIKIKFKKIIVSLHPHRFSCFEGPVSKKVGVETGWKR